MTLRPRVKPVSGELATFRQEHASKKKRAIDWNGTRFLADGPPTHDPPTLRSHLGSSSLPPHRSKVHLVPKMHLLPLAENKKRLWDDDNPSVAGYSDAAPPLRRRRTALAATEIEVASAQHLVLHLAI